MLKIKPLLVLAVLFLSLSAHSSPAQQWVNDCGRAGGKRAYKYCITRTPGSQNQDILWFFHGSGGSEKTWVKSDSTRSVQDLWAQQGFDPPTVISISFAAQYILRQQAADAKKDPYSGLLNKVVDEVMPFLESKVGGPERQSHFGGHLHGRLQRFSTVF